MERRRLPTVTHSDVVAAFEDESYLKEDDDRLLAYPNVLCSTVIRSEEVRLLANNRCITLNAVLTKRFVEGPAQRATQSQWRSR